MPGLTPMGLMRNLPYYYLGYLFGQYGLFRECKPKYDLIGFVLFMAGSILFFAWHLHAFYAGQHLLHIVLFYPVNIGFLFGVLYGCKCMNSIHSKVIINMSIGTLVIIGLHIVLITITNYIFGLALKTDEIICYQWYEALPIAIMIVALIYPIILFGKQHAPVLLGKKNQRII